jgi:hypothetical protein
MEALVRDWSEDAQIALGKRQGATRGLLETYDEMTRAVTVADLQPIIRQLDRIEAALADLRKSSRE